MKMNTRSPRVISSVLTWVLFAFLAGTSVHAQSPVGTAPSLSLSVNNSIAPTIYQGWPVLFELALTAPGVAQSNGNVVPIPLSLPSGSWADGIQLTVIDSSGNVQTWPATLVYHPSGADGSIVLNAGVEGRLAWILAPSSTTGIFAGTYRATALLNASAATASGAFNGAVASNPVTIAFAAEPSPLSASLQESKYTLLAAYDLLQGNQTQAQTDLQTLLTNQPNSIVGMIAMGDLLNIQGQPATALQYYDQAVAAFSAAYPSAPEPLDGLTDRQASTRAGLISQSGAIALPRVSVSVSNQGVQSPGVYFFDLLLKNIGPGMANIPQVSQLSYLTVSGVGQASYDTTISPALPVGVDSLLPGASATVRIYLDIPPDVSQFTINVAGTAQDIVGTTYSFDASQTINPNSILAPGRSSKQKKKRRDRGNEHSISKP